MLVFSKNELRTGLKEKRSLLNVSEVITAGQNIYGYLSLNIFENDLRTIILMFASYQNEPDTYVIYKALKKDYSEYDIGYPRISEDNINMEFYKIDDVSQLVCGYKGIQEPDITGCRLISTDELCLSYQRIVIIMPGIAFDSKGARAGYGKGFYDRYLMRLNKSHCIKPNAQILKIGICHDFQYIDNGYIITEEHDIRCDCVITDKRIIFIKEASHYGT